MIITQKKPMEELMAMVGDAKTVAIVGCNSCATACHTGGEPEVAALAKALEAAGKKVVGTTIADYCCMNLGVKQDEAPRRGKAGLRDLYVLRRRRAVRRKKCPRHPHLSVQQHHVPRRSRPLRRLGRGVPFLRRLRSGPDRRYLSCDPVCQEPCQRSLRQKNGKCEVNPENDCAWIKIYKRLGEIGQLDKLGHTREDKGYAKFSYPRTISLKGKK